MKIKTKLDEYISAFCKHTLPGLKIFIFLILVVFCVSSFYTHYQMNKRFDTVENMNVWLFQGLQDLDGRLGVLEARYDVQQKNLLVTFINSKHPSLDSAYVELLVNTIVKYSDKFQHIYPMLLTSLMWYESGFDTLAVSHKNAQGIMQILPSTAQAVVVQYDLPLNYNLLTLEDNVRIGCLYLNNLIARYGEFNALSRYNSGSVSNVGMWYAAQITKFRIEGLELRCD